MPLDASPTYRSSDIRSPIEQALEWSAALPVRKAWPRLAVLWAFVALLDMASGRLVSLNALYMVPLCLTTWCFGRTLGLISGAAAVILTLTINGFGDGLSAQASTVPALAAAWNAGMRIAAVAFLIFLVSAFRRTFDRERINARIDPLTGIGNRRSFVIESRNLELAATRDQRILLCGLIDLDDFKLINDMNGHGVGDQILQIAAGALRSAVRPYDAVARIGGDELAFWLIVRNSVSAEQTATKIFESVAAALRAAPFAATCSLSTLVMLAGGLLLVSVLLWLEAGDALRVLGMAGPETIGWFLTFEISSFADALAVATLAWSSWSGGAARLRPSNVIRRVRAGYRRMRRTRSTKATKSPAANDDDPYVLSCAAQ